MLETILSIVGTFIGIGLALNAYFIKQLLDQLTEMKINYAVDKQKLKFTEVRVKALDDSQADIYKRLWALENKDKLK